MEAIPAVYCLAVGAMMAIWWGSSIRSGALTRSDRSRPEIVLHVAAEGLTATLLVVGGVVLLADGSPLVAASALGMLLYTVIASPGYFLARGEPAPVLVFGVLAVLTATALVALWALVGQPE